MSNQPEKGVDLAHPPLSPPPFFLHLSQNQQYRCSTEFIPRFRRGLSQPSLSPKVQKFFGQQSSDSKLARKISIFFFLMLHVSSSSFLFIYFQFTNFFLYFILFHVLIYSYFLLYSILLLIKRDVNFSHVFSYIFMYTFLNNKL